MSEKQITILDLDSMLDISMDKVETLPDFINPPAGTYDLDITECKIEKYTPKKTNENHNPTEAARIKLIYSVESTIQLSDPKDLPVRDNSLFSESFMYTEDGLRYFKRKAMNIMNVSDLEGATLKDAMDGLKGTKFKAAVTVVKTQGKDADTSYENVRVRPVHGVSA